MKMNKTKKFLRIVSVFLLLATLFLVGCEEDVVFHPSGKDDLAVMGSADSQPNGNGGGAKKRVAITFDDGPHPRLTPKILDILKEYNINSEYSYICKKLDIKPITLSKVLQSLKIKGLIDNGEITNLGKELLNYLLQLNNDIKIISKD